MHELELNRFSVAVTTGTHAIRTQLDIKVRNPGREQLEAFMRLPIPPGAAVTRAVLYVGERAMEGVFVARERASNIYQSITQRRRDPALIAWHGREWLDVSVFPVEPGARRRIQLEWIEPTALAGQTLWYRIPLVAHAGRMVGWPDTVVVNGNPITRLGRTWLSLGEATTPPAASARVPGEPFSYVFSPASPLSATPPSLVLLAETSAAMTGQDRARQREAIAMLLSILPSQARVSLLSADFTVQVLAQALRPGQLEVPLRRLDGIVSAGAMDLEQALQRASAIAEKQNGASIVFVGRGVDAFSGDGTSNVAIRLREARQSLVALVGNEHPTALADLAAVSGGFALSWAEALATPRRVRWGLTAPAAALNLSSLERFFPLETVTGETRWLARLIGESLPDLAPADLRELEALWTRAHVPGTTSRDANEGVQHKVVTPQTSLLVLETTADYARWGLPAPEEGKSGADPMLGAQPLEQGGRTWALGRDPDRGRGVGLLGNSMGGEPRLLGISAFGYRANDGGATANRLSAAEVTPGVFTAVGSLDKEIIRRIVRLHLKELRYCYEQELARNAALQGRIKLQFTIGANGQVFTSVLQSSTMNNTRVEHCAVNTVRGWEFPRPTKPETVMVQYPFDFGRGARTRAMAPLPQPTPEPLDRWQLALAELRKPGQPKAHLAVAARLLDAPFADTPDFLAWWLLDQRLRRGENSPHARFLIAELLHQGGQELDAIRVLSEAAVRACNDVEAKLLRWNHTDEAERLRQLRFR